MDEHAKARCALVPRRLRDADAIEHELDDGMELTAIGD